MTTDAKSWSVDCVAAAEAAKEVGVLDSVLLICACLKCGSFLDRKVNAWEIYAGECQSDLIALLRLLRWVIRYSNYDPSNPQRFDSSTAAELRQKGFHLGPLNRVLSEYASSRGFYSHELKQAEPENAEELMLEVMIPQILAGPQTLWACGPRGFYHDFTKAFLGQTSVVSRNAKLLLGIPTEVDLPDRQTGGTYTARFLGFVTEVSVEQLEAHPELVEVTRSKREYDLDKDVQVELIEVSQGGAEVYSAYSQTQGSPELLADRLRSLLTNQRWGFGNRCLFPKLDRVSSELAEVMVRNVAHQRALADLCGPERDPCEASTGAWDRLLAHFVRALDGACRLCEIEQPERLLLPALPAAILAPYVESLETPYAGVEDILIEGDLEAACQDLRQRIGSQNHLRNLDAIQRLNGVTQELHVVQTDGVNRKVRDPSSRLAAPYQYFPLIDPDELVVRIRHPKGGISTLEKLHVPETLTEAQAKVLAQIETGAGDVLKLDETAEADLAVVNSTAELLLAGKLEEVPKLTLRDFSGIFAEFGLMISRDTSSVLKILGPPTRWTATQEFGEMKATRIAQKELFEHGLFVEVFAVQDAGTLGISLRAQRRA